MNDNRWRAFKKGGCLWFYRKGMNKIQRILNEINFYKKMRKQMLSMDASTFMMEDHMFCRYSIKYKFPQECKRDDCASCECYLNERKKYFSLFDLVKSSWRIL